MTETRIEPKIDRIARWFTLVFASLGVAFYSIGLVTEMDRIARDFWEDGIVLGFVYSSLTALGALRSFRPELRRGLHFASALANVLVGYVLVMFWVGLFTGKIDRGAEFIPLLVTIAYLVILRGIRIREFFRPPRWSLLVVITCTTLNFIVPEVIQQRSLGFTIFAGAVSLATLLAWAVFLILGFRRSTRIVEL